MAAGPGLCVENRTSGQLSLNFTLFHATTSTIRAPAPPLHEALNIRIEASKPNKMVFRSALIGLKLGIHNIDFFSAGTNNR